MRTWSHGVSSKLRACGVSWSPCVLSPQVNQLLSNPALYGLEPGSPDEERVLHEIMHEASMLATLRHPCILSFRGIVATPDHRNAKYVLFELASCSLKDYLSGLGRAFTLLECKQLCHHLLSALVYLVQRDVVHRDLKPANVLVFLDASGGTRYKVGDVGLARFVSSHAGMTSMLQTARFGGVGASATMTNAGTPLYRAPEIDAANETSRYSAKVDVFSFGVMVLEVLATRVIPDSTFPVFASPYQLPGMCEYVLQYLHSVGEAALADMLKSCVAIDPKARLTAPEAMSALRAFFTAPDIPVHAALVHLTPLRIVMMGGLVFGCLRCAARG